MKLFVKKYLDDEGWESLGIMQESNPQFRSYHQIAKMTDDKAEALAESIVQAVNNHDRLSSLESYFLEAQASYDKVKAENERLREALKGSEDCLSLTVRTINDTLRHGESNFHNLEAVAQDIRDTMQIARAALASE